MATIVRVFILVAIMLCLSELFKKVSVRRTINVGVPTDRKAAVASHVVKIEEFAQHYNNMSANYNTKFSNEYENLNNDVRNDQSFEVAQLPHNEAKNRYTNILPYDHSRVKLLPAGDDEALSDYINANWIPGYNSKEEFIACQGPLPATVDDHWRMIWEYNCQAIVMLTNCVEGKKNKCYHYWPHDREPMFYGDYQVQILRTARDKEHTNPHYIITEMTISRGKQVRHITHYHYVAWPDFGVPDDLDSLIMFVKKVRNNLSEDGGPIVVHCSAGVGRTGTFITLDRLFQTIDEHDSVDIYGIVHEMRMNRPFMVQTEAQYIFIYECLLFELQSRGIINEAFEEEDDVDIYENV